MRAAVLEAFGSPLNITTVPAPVAGTGEVVVDVVAAPILSYTDEVLSGERRYDLAAPVVPGCGAVGRVRTIGPDATRLAVGDWVLCDPTVRSRDNVAEPDITLQGWSARGEGGRLLQRYHHDGALAEQIRVPMENALALGPLDDRQAGPWCALAMLLVPYGGFLAAGLQAGEVVVVSGATGHYGVAAVAVALGMGAAAVVAPGRNQAVLQDLARRFGPRVRPVTLVGDEEADHDAMVGAAPGPIDCVLDILPPSVTTTTVRPAIKTLRPYGRAVLMGGVGMLGGPGLDLPYPWVMRNGITIHGQWMYPPVAVGRMASLIRSGLIDLGHWAVTDFTLDQANDAVAHAARGGPFDLTVVRP